MESDYKEQILPRLEASIIYMTLVEKCGTLDTEVITLVHQTVEYAIQRTKTILRHMGEFTLHDSEHLFRVLHIMGRLIGKDNVSNYSIPELQLLIIAAFFHDIGMAPEESNVIAWKKIWDANPQFNDSAEMEECHKFQVFYYSNPELAFKINQAIESNNYTLLDSLKAMLVTEYIRKSHADKAREIIDKDWGDKIKFRNTDLTVELASICYSHNQNAQSLNELDKSLLCDAGKTVCLPLIGILLRLSDILDFDGKRTPNVLYNHLSIKNPISLNEWQKHRSVQAWEINSNIIQFSARCEHPVIEASIHSFCDIIDEELGICNNLISELNDFYLSNGRKLEMKIPYKVSREKIQTKKDTYGKPKYIFRNTKFELSKRQVIELLMGTKLYGSSEVALRELVQNSIDACLLRETLEQSWENHYTPKIVINLSTLDGENFLEVNDNGIGMDQNVIDNYYSKVGSSFYKSSDFYSLKSESKSKFNPTSRFGIGILSSFMIADTLEVETRKVISSHTYSEPLKVKIEGQESIFYITQSKKTEPGTSTKLLIRKNDNPWLNYDDIQFISFVKRLIPKPPFEIVINRNGSTIEIINEHSFLARNIDELKDYTWGELENIKVLEFSFDENGIKGKAKVGILVEDNKPVSGIMNEDKTVKIEGMSFPLRRNISIDTNQFSKHSTSITVDDNGDIQTSETVMSLAKSKCQISFHGIEVPYNIVPDSWLRRQNLATLQWTLPFLMFLDISEEYDLDLNSSRTEILSTDKWSRVEEELAYIFAKNIATQIGRDEWENLKSIYNEKSNNELFKKGINRFQF